MNILNWINAYRNALDTTVDQVNLSDLTDWHYEDGEIKRKDSAFFTVVGIKSDDYPLEENELPIINQPEIGILGFLINHGDDGARILLHAKSEPGDVGITQIGPSVQATESNYKVKHGGKSTNYLNFFLDDKHPKPVNIKQSEQGTRFLNKYNLNAIIEIQEDEIEISNKKYKWFGLNDVISELNTDYLFNTDFRSVISHLLEKRILEKEKRTPLLNSYFSNTENDVENIINSIEEKRGKLQFDIKQVPLDELNNWDMNDTGIVPKKKNSFGFGYFNISMIDREVKKWGQPLVTKTSEENIVLLASKTNDEYHFIFKERMELGFKNYMQLGPTFQVEGELDLPENEILAEWKQSEEGGRFFQNISKYKICLTNQIDFYKQSDEYYILNVFEICSLLKTQGIFTNEARSAISGLLPLL
ncbi:NDP-hexose 2,3-dehydratase family protein [Patescibacteria group bacterium]|nr:NDP-hexose 2,3-dehydratase family protein [Patescibacteria group bacterium]MBU1682484.1 NDP-hexose 2,3-dehydratase family protein [Patescibacteria group bacterium]MBU1934700.1 NDP-hexose 2,3-dehydratase family protein [Patescibacteria group bacterium]